VERRSVGVSRFAGTAVVQIAFLASDDASYARGRTLYVNGGAR